MHLSNQFCCGEPQNIHSTTRLHASDLHTHYFRVSYSREGKRSKLPTPSFQALTEVSRHETHRSQSQSVYCRPHPTALMCYGRNTDLFFQRLDKTQSAGLNWNCGRDDPTVVKHAQARHLRRIFRNKVNPEDAAASANHHRIIPSLAICPIICAAGLLPI